MDPQATWIMLIDAWIQREWHDVHELAEALQHWIAKNGFPPDTCGTAGVGQEWNRTVALAVCEMSLRTAAMVLESPNGIPTEIPFTLACVECSNEGPDSFDEAVAGGWTRVSCDANGLSWNFLGWCPHCGNSEESGARRN